MSTRFLTDITLVLGPPLHDAPAFHDFQARAARGERVADHHWATHEYDAVDGLTVRDGSVSSHTLLETFVGGVLEVPVIIADVERRWVRHADDQLYVAVTFNTEDVRPRAAALTLQQEAAITALNQVASSLSTLDGRSWLSWSSRSTPDDADDERLTHTAQLMAAIADTVFDTAIVVGDDTTRDLTADLLHAITVGSAHAEQLSLPLVQTLRSLRHYEPLRVEWNAVHMDAFFLAALSPEQIDAKVSDDSAAGLAYLYIGRHRTEQLKADPYITARFHRELAARAYMTAYALQRLAPTVSQHLLSVMTKREE